MVEWLAAVYLRSCGYRILGRNIRLAGVEIDIVAWRNRRLLIVEVKSRASGVFVSPALAVCRARRKRQWRAAEAFFAVAPLPIIDVEFLVITVVGWRFRCYHDAFDRDDC